MKIPCFRCGKTIDTPGLTRRDTGKLDAKSKPIFVTEYNADYIIAPDTIVEEARDVFVALQHTKETKELKAADLAIVEEKFKKIEVANPEEASWLSDIERVQVESRMKPIQKTGIICPECYNPGTDTVLWGVHKKK